MSMHIFRNQLALILFGVVFLLSCTKKPDHIAGSGKVPPVAVAGPDQVITLPTDSTLLNGLASTDPDGAIQTWLWTKIEGPASLTIVSPAQAETKIFNLTGGQYRFELKVTDNDGLTAKDTIMITVNPALVTNHSPVANAGFDQSITLPTNSTFLIGVNSYDPDNNIIDYLWQKISGPLPFTILQPNNSQTPITGLIQGIYQFELTVTDAGGLQSKDTVSITVNLPDTMDIIYRDQVLHNACYDPRPGICYINGDGPSYEVYIPDTGNVLPDSAMASVLVWVRMDTSSVWESVPANCWQPVDPYPQTNFTYCLSPGGLRVWSWFFTLINLEGRKVDVRIRF